MQTKKLNRGWMRARSTSHGLVATKGDASRVGEAMLEDIVTTFTTACESEAAMDWELLGLVIAIIIPVGQGFLSTVFGEGGNSDWYKNLKKPWYTPPGWVFPVMWTTLYLLMGIASWLVWKEGGFKQQSLPLIVYAFQLTLNFLWTPLFFGLKQIGLALVEIVLMWFAIAATIYFFYPVSHTAAYLLVPYIVWVTLASSLNYYIWANNPPQGVAGDLSEPFNRAE